MCALVPAMRIQWGATHVSGFFTQPERVISQLSESDLFLQAFVGKSGKTLQSLQSMLHFPSIEFSLANVTL